MKLDIESVRSSISAFLSNKSLCGVAINECIGADDVKVETTDTVRVSTDEYLVSKQIRLFKLLFYLVAMSGEQ